MRRPTKECDLAEGMVHYLNKGLPLIKSANATPIDQAVQRLRGLTGYNSDAYDVETQLEQLQEIMAQTHANKLNLSDYVDAFDADKIYSALDKDQAAANSLVKYLIGLGVPVYNAGMQGTDMDTRPVYKHWTNVDVAPAGTINAITPDDETKVKNLTTQMKGTKQTAASVDESIDTINKLARGIDTDIDFINKIARDGMNSAFFIKKMEGWYGLAALYQLDEPIKYGNRYDKSTEYAIVSAVIASGEPETYIFPANSEGKIINKRELHGSVRGKLDHEYALRIAGYQLVGESPFTLEDYESLLSETQSPDNGIKNSF